MRRDLWRVPCVAAAFEGVDAHGQHQQPVYGIYTK